MMTLRLCASQIKARQAILRFSRTLRRLTTTMSRRFESYGLILYTEICCLVCPDICRIALLLFSHIEFILCRHGHTILGLQLLYHGTVFVRINCERSLHSLHGDGSYLGSFIRWLDH